MKKITLFLLVLSALMVLGGCVEDTVNQATEGKEKVEYVAKATNLAVTSSNATLELYNLYQSPLEYGTASWKEDFYANKEIVDDNYAEASDMNVPNGMEENHQKLLSVMEKTMSVNDTVDSGLQAGEKLTDSAVKELDEVVELYQNVTSLFEQ